MKTVTLAEMLAQAETLTLEEQLTLLAHLAERVRVVYSQQPPKPKKLTIDEHLEQAGYSGGRLFKTAEEVDAYIQEERDSWER